jgi:hypothetical protein
MPSKQRSITELEIFTTQVKQLGVSVRSLDEALNLLTWALSKNPRAFDEVPGMPNCYVAKTERWVTSGGIVIPALRVFYRIEDDDSVCLAAIGKII